MRIVIDMQGAQTESRFRDIGRYTLSFAQAIIRNHSEHEIILSLNGLFPDTIESIRTTFDGLLPQENIRIWYAPGPVMELHSSNDARRKVAELIREAFLTNLQPDVIHISSMFEGYIDDAVTSVGRLDRITPVSVSLYDLIPPINPDHYLKPDPRYTKYYQRKIKDLKQAAIYLAISEFTRQEGLSQLNLTENQITNVSTPIEPCFQPLRIGEQAEVSLRKKFGMNRPFVMCTVDTTENKTLRRLIEAFAALPASLRTNHQLLLAGRLSQEDSARLQQYAKSGGLKPEELCFIGYVTEEELIQLYNLCKLYVFPSWHEGFGFPVLEAMACGAPVIGANTSNLPEVIGLNDALFNPLDVTTITAKMAAVLENETFRTKLREHGLQQAKKFSWDETAKRSIAAWKSLLDRHPQNKPACLPTDHKPRLAFVSPLPPERTGIADYSAELLPALAAYYDIEVVVAQDQVDDPWVRNNCSVRDVTWLSTHASEIDRILYQVGNSPFHRHMLSLMQEIPGTVVLHDFFISGLMAWLELYAGTEHAWTDALYTAHGYSAVRERYHDAESAQHKYPVNLHILQNAEGLIVHSKYSQKLAEQWCGSDLANTCQIIPLLRAPAEIIDKAAARKQLGFKKNDFVICSFGFIGSTKLNHRLLHAWMSSALAEDKRCHLIFVGENPIDDYGLTLLHEIRSSNLGDRARITGFASPEMYRQYLTAADMAVQLRTHSRGETSAALLDCMNYALPLIVNANGSMTEVDPEAVWMLPDEFDDNALVEALETLWHEPERRRTLGDRAREIILNRHTPARCAQSYAEAIERFHHRAETSTAALIRTIAAQKSFFPNDSELIHLAENLSVTLPLPRHAKRLFLDVSATCRNDLKTGIERVAQSLLLALIEAPPVGYRIEPVYVSDAGGKWHYRYASRYTLDLLGCPPEALDDEKVEPECGDVLLGLDLSGDMLVQAEHAGLFAEYRNRSIRLYSIVFDLLPVGMPDVFPPGADRSHTRWLKTISTFDGAICISKAVADDLVNWQEETGFDWKDRRPFRIGWFPLGADVATFSPSRGLPANTEQTVARIQSQPSFLMVGTIEPRKGYLQTIKAFSQLWADGINVNLVIVGKEGWKHLPNNMRRDIPETIDYLQKHPELSQHLFWLEGISDEFLEKIYTASTCLIAASYGEGFGLPLIEAAQHKLPIIARDIPVFHEVAGEYAFYFDGKTPDALAEKIEEWLILYENDRHPRSDNMPWLTWKESAARLVRILIEETHEDHGEQGEMTLKSGASL